MRIYVRNAMPLMLWVWACVKNVRKVSMGALNVKNWIASLNVSFVNKIRSY